MNQPPSSFVPTPPLQRTPLTGPVQLALPTISPDSPALPAGPGQEGGAPRWIWEAMAPGARRDQMTQMAKWVDWLRARHGEPPLTLHEKIPACWYMHPGPLDVLSALYAEWIRIHNPDSEIPLLSFYDALARHAPNLGYPGTCLRRTHDDGRDAEPFQDFATWLKTSTWATKPAVTITFLLLPERTAPVPTASAVHNSERPPAAMAEADVNALLASGLAERIGHIPAVRIDGAWWLGSEGIYVRVDDAAMTADLDRHLAKYTAGQAAMARYASTPLIDSPPPTAEPRQER
ncbi:hypothetical protein [Streptosporangium sp. CA-115845]|uniref:hypothetical protein n=1 Tax=Streptosporangium sp. CA-115845 TaxID=3240071 RepID=UPI003D8EA4B2